MTNQAELPDHQSFDRRTLIKSAAALAATAVSIKAASAATAPPLGQTGAPTRSTGPLPLGPLPGSRYPDAHLEFAKPKLSFGPNGFPAFAGTMAVERVATGMLLGGRAGLLPGRALRAVQRHSQQPHHALLGG